MASIFYNLCRKLKKKKKLSRRWKRGCGDSVHGCALSVADYGKDGQSLDGKKLLGLFSRQGSMWTHSGLGRQNPFGKKLFQHHRKQRKWLGKNKIQEYTREHSEELSCQRSVHFFADKATNLCVLVLTHMLIFTQAEKCWVTESVVWSDICTKESRLINSFCGIDVLTSHEKTDCEVEQETQREQ